MNHHTQTLEQILSRERIGPRLSVKLNLSTILTIAVVMLFVGIAVVIAAVLTVPVFLIRRMGRWIDGK